MTQLQEVTRHRIQERVFDVHAVGDAKGGVNGSRYLFNLDSIEPVSVVC